ncbi:MAG: hypothetical protein M3Q42_01870 [Pseudomonadota bacterium]|nr:hypothetical protein [Pseudomonadota bacterium]
MASPTEGRPPLVVPRDAGTVLERLPAGYSALAGPVGTESILERVNAQLATAARTGDARLVTRAARLMATLPERQAAQPDALKAAAYIAQYHHDFSAALRALDAAVDADPRDAGARLARSQLHLVMGRLDLARRDCAALVLGIDSSRGRVCLAALALRRDDPHAAIGLSDRWLVDAALDNALRFHVLLIRAEAAARSGDPEAGRWFRQAMQVAPADVRALVPYARHLRQMGRHAEVISLRQQAPANDSLQLQATLAAWEGRLPQAEAMADATLRRYRRARVLGSEPELREEAEFLLRVRGDAAGALALARRNFTTQRDHEDVQILVDAALAADQPAALEPLRQWAKAQDVSLPALPEAKP